jgi:hypothetical protein
LAAALNAMDNANGHAGAISFARGPALEISQRREIEELLKALSKDNINISNKVL